MLPRLKPLRVNVMARSKPTTKNFSRAWKRQARNKPLRCALAPELNIVPASLSSLTSVGRWLASDRRSKSKTVAKKGEGDRRDQKRAAPAFFNLLAPLLAGFNI